MKKNIKKQKSNRFLATVVFMVIGIFLLTSGYAAFGDSLGITSGVSYIRAHKVVRVNGVTTSSGAVSDLNYSHDSIVNAINIPNGESITYSTTITNLGNVPMAVSDINFINRAGEPVSGLTANINNQNFVKICDGNNCEGPITKTIDITITNNSGSTINNNIDVVLTFTRFFNIIYEGNKIGEVIEGGNFSYTFQSNPPANIAKTSGTSATFSYSNGTISMSNVTSDITLLNAHTITYNGTTLGYIAEGGTFTKNLEPEFPETVTKDSGTCDSFTYQNHIVTITNVRSDITLTGTIGTVKITSITHVEGSDKNVLSSTPPTFSGMDASFNIVFQRPEGSTEEDFETTYEVSITNSHYTDYIFRGLDFNPSITASAGSDTANLTLVPIGIENGETISSESAKTFRVKLVLTPNNPDGNYSTSTNTQVDTTADTEEETGTITAVINSTTGDLRLPNTTETYTVTVTSTYPSAKTFKLFSSNSYLEIVDSNGNPLGDLTIPGESSEPYTIYIKKADGATFASDTTSMTMSLKVDGMASINVDDLTFNVDKYAVPDTTKVKVGNLQLAYFYDTSDKTPKIKATWDRIDVGGSRIVDYVVTIYGGNHNPRPTCHTNSATRECLISGLSENTNYYAVVYGIDEAGNTGSADAASATTADGYATRSPGNSSFVWTYAVDTSGVDDNLTIGGDGSTAILGAKYTLTLRATGGSNYTAPATPTVTMDGSSSGFYTYKRSDSNRLGTIEIEVVTGKITVSGNREGYCLKAGTKILMADGSYKNIENIDYDDLLAVWNYDTGSITYTYPAFIEKSLSVNSYTKTTFDDGTVLNTYDSHAIFSYDLKRYILTTDTENYKVGAKMVKIENGKVKIITIKKIETINENTKVYHVVSNGYFNLIANDVLTTEPNIMISNQYGFTDNVKWPDGTRENIINNPDNLYSYDLFSDIMPHYMFKALRVDEGKFVVDKGLISFDLLKLYLATRPANPEYFKDLPKNSAGKRLITITTSLDNVNLYNKNNYIYEEGTYYTLPNRYNIKCYLNTNNNTCYEKGSKVKVDVSTHFIAVYK